MTEQPGRSARPIRTLRIEDHLWHAAQSKATEQGTTVSEVIRHLLRDWTEPNLRAHRKGGVVGRRKGSGADPRADA